MIQDQEVIRAKLALLRKSRAISGKVESDTCLTMIDLLRWVLCEDSAFEVLIKQLETNLTSYLEGYKNN